MLTNLSVRNFAIIESLELSLGPGFSVLSGETGAGKSILIDAIELVLGDRADVGVIRDGSDRAEISAEFDVADLPEIRQWLELNDLDENGDCIVRRVVTLEGRSRGYLNGRSVTMQTLRELGEQLVDIHGQHEHQSLTHQGEQRALLDRYGRHETLQKSVADSFTAWQARCAELDSLRNAQDNREAQLDLLRFQVAELEALGLQENELEKLHAEHARFQHASKILEHTRFALDAVFENDEITAHGLLGEALEKMHDAASRDPDLTETCTMLETSLVNLEEAASNLRDYLGKFSVDPERRDQVEERIASAQQLARKHRTEPDDLVALLPRLRKELDDLENSSVRLDELEREVKDLADEYSDKAGKLSTARKKTAARLGKEITAAMQELGLQGSRFAITVERRDCDYSVNGLDRIEFEVQPNAGQPMKPLRKIASGGELSRISLAIQVIASSASNIVTMIFDEVDSGVGGGVAELVGRRLRGVAGDRQVLCVTHLPQVASHANTHFQVDKQTRNGITRTTVNKLDQEQRVAELARMLGGVEITDTTLEHAREMIVSAENVA